MKFRLLVEPDPETNRWSAVFPELPGCASAGDTEAEAIANAKEALELWFEPSPVKLHKGAKLMELAMPWANDFQFATRRKSSRFCADCVIRQPSEMASRKWPAGDSGHARQQTHPIGTLKSIVEGSGLDVEDFRWFSNIVGDDVRSLILKNPHSKFRIGNLSRRNQMKAEGLIPRIHFGLGDWPERELSQLAADERGNVIGIVSAKLNASAALAASGALPENVNYAVKSSLLLSFLESVPTVSAKLKAPITADRKFGDVVQSAQNAAVLVLVYWFFNHERHEPHKRKIGDSWNSPLRSFRAFVLCISWKINSVEAATPVFWSDVAVSRQSAVAALQIVYFICRGRVFC
jgi:predicted RNase H-like HicB family nuclease